MGNLQPQFRTTALGGFHKQDVLDYVEASGREHARQTEELKKECSEIRADRDALLDRLEQAEQERDSLNRRVEELESQLARQTAELEERLKKAEAQSARAEQDLAAERDGRAEVELKAEELEKRLKKAEPLAQAYESVKDRTAGIELEAHHRAMEVEAAAREQVRATKAQLEQWIHKTMAGYDRLRTDVDATISHAAGELERVKEQLAGVSGELEQRDAELEQMLHNYQETLGPKAPEPLPLEEE